MKIQGSTVLITGAGRGIGRAFARMAAREGAHVHVVLRKPDPTLLLSLRDAGAASVEVWLADLSERAGVERLAGELKNREIDILFNNAGQLTGGLLEEQPLDEIYSMLQVNLASLVHLTRALLPGMIGRGRGKIVNNSSVSAVMHFPCASTYAASKAAVLAFTECLQLELKGTGVTALGLLTPGIKTRMFDEIADKYAKNLEIPQESMSPEAYAELIRSAILNDDPYYRPGGATGVGLFVARHLPPLFRWAAGRKFHR